LASQLSNFISTLFGAGGSSILSFSCQDGKVVWKVSLPLAESSCFPINPGEGYINYLGRVFSQNIMAYMGNWRPTTSYCKNFLVKHDGVLWIALQDVPAGVVPAEGAFWTEFLQAGTAGTDGWSPVFALVADGSAREVLQVVDWVGGDGVKPATGMYVGSGGFTFDISLAVNLRGADGAPGINGTNGVDGRDGQDGRDGADGIYPVSTVSVAFVQPAANANVQIQIGNTGWMVVGQPIFITSGGFYEVVSINSPVLVTVKNLGSSQNAAPGTTISAGVGVAIGAFV
jgi:hypothetical protein